MRPLSLIFALACGPSAPAPSRAPEPTAPEEAATPAPAPLPAVLGLQLGQARHAEILAWISERELSCTAAPATTRTAFQYRCEGELPLTLLAPRVVGGKWTRLLISRPDEGPAHHLSMVRRHSLPERVVEDYDSTVALITGLLGAPSQAQPIAAAAALKGPALRYNSRWEKPGLDVQVSAMRFGKDSDPIEIHERWTLTGTLADEERPEGRSANPHIGG